MKPYVERTDGWLFRWRAVYPTGGPPPRPRGMNLETMHFTRLGAWFSIKVWHNL